MGNKILFWIGVFFILTVPIYIGIRLENAKISMISAACAGFIIFVSKMDTIAEITLGPLKAKMRETIQEANATIAQLKTISASSAKTTLTGLMADGFMGGVSLKAKLDLHDQLIESLKKVGFSNQEIDETDEMWKRGIRLIYHRTIRKLIEKIEYPNDTRKQALVKTDGLRKNFEKLLDFDNWQAPSPDEIKQFLESEEILTEEMEEWVADYQHFIETGEIRRRDLFIQQ